MSPDPKHVQPEKDLSCSDVPVHIVDSDEDDEPVDIDYNNYMILPQSVYDGSQPAYLLNDSDVSEDDGEEEVTDEANTSTEAGNLWNIKEHVTDIVMDKDKQQQVMSAMAGFSLPQTAIPAWAKDIPEEEWKNVLSAKLKQQNV